MNQETATDRVYFVYGFGMIMDPGVMGYVVYSTLIDMFSSICVGFTHDVFYI